MSVRIFRAKSGIPVARRTRRRLSWPLRGHWDPYRIVQPPERVIHADTPSWKQLPDIWARQILLLLLGICLLALTPPDNSSPAVLAWVVMGVAAVQMLLKLAQWWFTRYMVTSSRLLVARGVWKRRIQSIPHSRITQVHFSQSVLERFLGLATVHVMASGQDSPLEIRHLNKPETFHHILNSTLSGSESGTTDEGPYERAETTIEFGQGDVGPQGWVR